MLSDLEAMMVSAGARQKDTVLRDEVLNVKQEFCFSKLLIGDLRVELIMMGEARLGTNGRYRGVETESP